MNQARKKATWLIIIFSASMSIPLFFWIPKQSFWNNIGINADSLGYPSVWGFTLLVILSYSLYTIKVIPTIKTYIFEFSGLRIAAIWLAVASGILEEVIFRQYAMEYLSSLNFSIYSQVIISSVFFGLTYAVWVFVRGEIKIALPVILSTSTLGLMLASLYIYSDMNLIPCIVAHIFINLIIEPGLLMSAITGDWNSKNLSRKFF